MMKHFAIDNRIRTGASVPIGGVELTEAEYRQTLDAMIAGQEVIVINGALVVRDRAPSPDHTWENGEWVAPPEPEPKPPEPPSQITMRQLIIGLATDGWITWPEAEAWADRSTLPAAVNAVIDQMPEEERPAARITAKTMSVAERDNPLLIGAAKLAEPEKSDEEIAEMIADAFTRWSEI